MAEATGFVLEVTVGKDSAYEEDGRIPSQSANRVLMGPGEDDAYA